MKTRDTRCLSPDAQEGLRFRVVQALRGGMKKSAAARTFGVSRTSIDRWLEEAYPAIEKQAKAENAEIHWGDQMGLRSDHQAGTSYGRRGQTPAIPGTGQRFRRNLISTITNRGELSFMVFQENFTAAVFIKFVCRLLRLRQRKVLLIVDRHPVHLSAGVKRWLAQHAGQIELFFLPGYGQDLNPDEFLNQDVKSNALGRQRPATRGEMIEGVRSYLRSTQRQPAIVKRYFHAESVRYAAG